MQGLNYSSSASPYCLTVKYQPDYYTWFCTDTLDMTWTMEPTWSGMQSPILFLIYTGSKGILTRTQYPTGYRSVTETSEEPSRANTGVSADDEPSDTDTASIRSSPSSSSRYSSSSTPIGAIVGGVVASSPAQPELAFNPRPSPFSPYFPQDGYPGTSGPPPRGQWAGVGFRN